ncbi:MAG: insulinase family protein [Mucilaginibacter polytrichastri]|nr:insulinase family protein [Mucilaginibacter polytrichastri]
MEYQVHTFRNGIRLLHVHHPSPISHCCLVINAGSRDESDEKSGLAHYLEHMLFKGTQKRNTSRLLNYLEVVGADLNAYTTKEYTCLHASFLHQYLNRAIDLLHDIAFRSVFPETEMEKEKEVVLDEIASYLDQPEEAIQDDFEDQLFAGHKLGRNILGRPENVKAFSQKDLADFIAENYNTHEIVFAVAGDYALKDLVRRTEKFFGEVPENTTKKHRAAPGKNSSKISSVQKPIGQTHCVIGAQAYSLYDKKRPALMLLNNYLGAGGMSARLNMELREKRGIAYTIESNYTSMSDTGIFSIYFGTDEEKAQKALRVIHSELKRLRQNQLSTQQLQHAKQRFIGQIALAEENRIGLIIGMAKNLLDRNRVDSLPEVFAKINAVTAAGLLETSNEILDEAWLQTLIFAPED